MGIVGGPTVMPRASAPRSPIETVPLLVWDELHQVEQLRAERQALITRIAQYPRFSHRRVRLEAQLAELTHRIIQAELAIGRNLMQRQS